VQLGVECPVCHKKFRSASARKAHVSTVVSAGCSGESLSVYAPHLFASDLLCVCYVLLCVPALQHNKGRNFPCQQCEHRSTSKGNLKSHVLSKVSAGEAVLCACDRPSDLSCVLLYIPTALRLGGYSFVGNLEMAPFFWLAPGGANFLLCLLLRRHCCSAYLLSKTQEVLF
jgi:hypothetical protein